MANFITLSLLSFLTVNAALATELNCSFVHSDRDYTCETYDVFSKDFEAASTIENPSTESVVKFLIPKESESSFIPIGFCKHFSKLKKIEIFGKNIKEISRAVFSHCDKVCASTVHISGTQISWLPEDLFKFLVNLQTLNLSGNKIKYLPMNLLKQNKNLKTFAAKNNRIERIDLLFSESVAVADLTGNECINEFVIGYKNVRQLNEMVRSKCKVDDETNFQKINEPDECQTKLRAKIEENEKLKNENIKINKKLDRCEMKSANLSKIYDFVRSWKLFSQASKSDENSID